MIISTDISDTHEGQILEAAPYRGMGTTDWVLRRVLFHLAARAEAFAEAGQTIEAEIAEELFASSIEAAIQGEMS
jgi:hypothetical protein